jgi:hypothetical protein
MTTAAATLLFVLVFCLFFLYAYRYFSHPNAMHEGFTQTSPFVLKLNDEIYDAFYMEVYDKLYVPERGAASLSRAIERLPYLKKKLRSMIVSDTGNLMGTLRNRGFTDAHTVHKSSDAVAHMRSKYRDNVINGDILLTMFFGNSSIASFIFADLSFYRYDTDKRRTILGNIRHWLTPHGLLLVHLVDSQRFDTVLPAAREFMDLQKYASERITANEVDFNSFSYLNSYEFAKDRVVRTETFTDKSTQFVRKNEQTFYMPTIRDSVLEICARGFVVKEKKAIPSCGNVLYVFRKE